MPKRFAIDAEPALVAVDPTYLVLRKPVGMHSAPLPKTDETAGPTLCEWVFARFPDAGAAAAGCPDRPEPEGGLLHRLDRETSGLVLFARTPRALETLLREQAAGAIVKDYLARSAPTPGLFPAGSRPPRTCPAGAAERPWSRALDRAAAGEGEELSALVDGAAAAGRPLAVEGRFRPYGRGARAVACLGLGVGTRRQGERVSEEYRTFLLAALAIGGELELRLRILRGFRHQIRAQLAWIGLPILGDGLYGGGPAERLHLHAARLEFRHPESGDTVVVEG